MILMWPQAFAQHLRSANNLLCACLMIHIQSPPDHARRKNEELVSSDSHQLPEKCFIGEYGLSMAFMQITRRFVTAFATSLVGQGAIQKKAESAVSIPGTLEAFGPRRQLTEQKVAFLDDLGVLRILVIRSASLNDPMHLVDHRWQSTRRDEP